MLCQFFQPLLAVTSKSFLANQTLPSYSSLCCRDKNEMVSNIQRHRGSSKRISRILKTFHYKIWGFSSFVRLAHLSPGDSVEEMVCELQPSRTLLLCEQTVLEDAPILPRRNRLRLDFFKAILRFTVNILEFEEVTKKPISPYCIHDAGLD